MLIGQLTLIITAAYLGTTLYIMVVEQRARMQMEDAPMLKQWKLSRKYGFPTRVTLACTSFLLAVASWYLSGDWRWGLGAAIIFSNWPLRIFAIMPINNRLAAMSAKMPEDDARELVERWGRLHNGRVAIAVVATAVFAWAMA